MGHPPPRALGLFGMFAFLVGCAAAEPPPAPRVHTPVEGRELVAMGQATPRVVTDLVDTLGRPVTVGCATCHSLPGVSRAGRPVTEAPTRMHEGLVVNHGVRADLRCDSCHAGPDYGALKTADGRRVEYAEVNTLCRQCHGPQARDFDHGAHGGMQGHWDLKFGDRQRHACVTCHDPHAPKFAAMWPARPPGDVRWKGDHKKTGDKTPTTPH